MVDITSHQQANDKSSRPREWISRFVLGMAGETLFLMALGSATRVMNAGLACPDWPLCYGVLVPQKQMNLQVFLEWFHRLTASSMGLFAITLFGLCLWYRRELPKWTPWIASLALFLVIFQGILGALTVTELLRFDIVTAHLGTALLFFITLLSAGVALQPYQGNGTAGRLSWVAAIAAICVYAQSILGALVGSQWALHQCLSDSTLCGVMNSHIAGVVPATLATLTLTGWALRTPALHPSLRRLANFAGSLLVLQIALGVATFKLRLQVETLTIAHQAIGAMLLGVLVTFTVLAFRDMGVSETDVPIKSISLDEAIASPVDGQPA
ncbi:heme A synthase [Phormidium sp. CLA17]|uniref:COX15/CtaA family protein n=1 Tax=Leptolyngbya sp. Cla-17 TaxID=2803751 RepID=UPI0014925C1F|nr:heme A synthase [Leptolyngbya sp. Cla-17]MBM0740175.1 heme A synthase [Leptolyngbya sp. Cla-17]